MKTFELELVCENSVTVRSKLTAKEL